MSFKRFVCWDPGRVPEVMRIDADAALPPVFMAVHTEEPLAFERPEGHRSAREFLDEFLTGSGDIRAVVKGDSGSGKSHLVRWVELNIPPDRTDLQVVSVPRSGTSLRWIVQRLIEELPPDMQGDYRKKLVATPDSPIRFKELELRLLTDLALALKRSEYTDEVDVALAAQLNAFVLDPEMWELHTGRTGIVADLVMHITEQSGREARDARRRFEESDLHLDAAMTRLNDFAAPTVTLLRLLQADAQLRERAVALVNDQLDVAVAETLGLGGGELTELLNGIRRHLRTMGRTLVLLIEDFVRTEGIDRILLDALIDSRDELCDLRLLIAITTGYYDRELIETQKTRLHFIISLDKRSPLDEGNRLAPFAARYLNALRVADRELEQWYEESQSDGVVPPLPNACSGCEHREPCHAAFGTQSLDTAGDVGLYPFTALALSNMAQRARERSPSEGAIDPRSLLRDVLIPIAGDRRARRLIEGTFPDEQLVENHGGSKLPLHVEQQVRTADREQADRHLAVLELWSARPREATHLPADLYRAFALAPLTLGEAPPEESAGSPEPTPFPEPEPSIAPALQRRLDAIQSWHNRGPMTGVTDDLRRLVMNAVAAAIDWDGESLERAVFAGGRGSVRDWEPFRRTNISFSRQDTTPARAAVTLPLPLSADPDSQLRTALALQGLVNFEHYGHWRFQDGLEQLLAVSEEAPRWAEHVVEQIRRVHDPEREWDPVASAVEALAVGAALASRPPQLDASTTERLAAILDEDWPDPGALEVRSDKWRALYRRIHDQRTELREVVLAHASAMKGGQAGSMLDADRVVGPLRALSRNWELRGAPPKRLAETELPRRYRRLFDLHSDVRSGLADAAQDELAQRNAWLDDLREHVPDGVARRDVVESIEQLEQAIAAQGIPVREDYVLALREALEFFRSVQLDEAVRMAEEFRDTESPAQSLLPRLAGERRGNAMRAWTQFRDPLMHFLDDAESKTRSEKERIGGAAMVEHQYERVEAAFAALEENLAAAVDS